MTRILLIPTANAFLFYESPLQPEELEQLVSSGGWIPPSPYGHLAGKLQVSRQEDLVLAAAFSLQPSSSPARLLPRRELQVLQCLRDGLTTRQIARRLNLAPRTVHLHVSRLKIRFQAATRAELVDRAISSAGFPQAKVDR